MSISGVTGTLNALVGKFWLLEQTILEHTGGQKERRMVRQRVGGV